MTNAGIVTLTAENGTATVAGIGELDLRIEEQFKQTMGEAVDTGMALVVDLRESDYIDTQILAAMVGPARKQHALSRRMRVIVQPGGQPEYVLNTVGFDAIMDDVPQDGGSTGQE
jgi:anti-anti-sigma regulatory factor